jgi:hypothetical protein
MKKALCLTVLALCLLTARAGAALPGYAYSGFGFQLGFIISDDTGPADIAGDMSGHGDIAFGLGPIGEIHYYPRIGVWFTGDEDSHNFDHFYASVHFDLFDAKYYPPIPEQVKVRPYFGMSPMLCLDIERSEYGTWVTTPVPHWDVDSRSDADADVGFNIFGGADFLLSSRFWLFTEMRGKFGDWDIFELSAGMTFVVGGVR